MKNRITRLLATAAAIGLFAGSTHAATITGVTIEDVSSELTGLDRLAVYTVDGSGFEPNGDGTHSTTPQDGTMWLTNGTKTTPNDPIGSYPDSFIEFDLEGNYDLSSTTVWNYNEVTNSNNLSNRGAKDVTISVASSVGGTFTSLGDFVFNQAPGNDTTDFGQTLSLSGANNVRLVRFDITSNHGGNNEFAGLSEVRFDGTLIPEPGSLALLGLGGLLIGARRRRG